jgi:hypothetical protein
MSDKPVPTSPYAHIGKPLLAKTGEVLGKGFLEWPNWCITCGERVAYQQGIADARALAKTTGVGAEAYHIALDRVIELGEKLAAKSKVSTQELTLAQLCGEDKTAALHQALAKTLSEIAPALVQLTTALERHMNGTRETADTLTAPLKYGA